MATRHQYIKIWTLSKYPEFYLAKTVSFLQSETLLLNMNSRWILTGKLCNFHLFLLRYCNQQSSSMMGRKIWHLKTIWLKMLLSSETHVFVVIFRKMAASICKNID